MIVDRLGAKPIPIQIPMGAEADFEGVIDLVEMKAWTFTGNRDDAPMEGPIPAKFTDEAAKWREKMIESIGEVDEQTMISFVEGHALTTHEIMAALRRVTLLANRSGEGVTATPVLCGSALKNKGVQILLDAVVEYLPSPDDVPPLTAMNPKTKEEELRKPADEEPFSALAFKIVTDPHMGRLAYFRVLGQAHGGLERLQLDAREDGARQPHHADAREPSRGRRRSGRGRHRRDGLEDHHHG